MPDFSFGFNNPQFSDRLLEVRVSGGDRTCARRGRQCSDGCAGCTGSVTRSQCKKRKTTEEEEQGSAGDGSERLHVSSLLLAAHSKVFKAMFTNGMLESKAQLPVILHVATQAEQDAAKQLVEFLYSNALPDSVTSFAALLELLLYADKYSVAPCVAACADRLTEWLTKWEATSAQRVALLSLPATAVEVKEVQLLIEEVEVELAAEFEHLDDMWQDPASPFLKLQYIEIESVLTSGHLRTVSEEILFSATLKWCRQYPMEQRVGYMAQLAQRIRFPQMSCEFMTNSVMQEEEMKTLESTRLVAEAGLFKASSLQMQQQLAASAKGHSRYELRRTGCRLAVEATLDQCKALRVGQSIEGAAQKCGEHHFCLRLYLKPAQDLVVGAFVCLVGNTEKLFPAQYKMEVFNGESQAWDTRLAKRPATFGTTEGGVTDRGLSNLVSLREGSTVWRTGTLRVRATLVPGQ